MLLVNLRSKFVFMLGGLIPVIHYQAPVCISYQINLNLEDAGWPGKPPTVMETWYIYLPTNQLCRYKICKNNAILPMLPATSLEPQDDIN